jgi:fatty-acyl-CoA synthase
VTLISSRTLSPITFLERSALVFPDRTAIVDGDTRLTYREFSERSHRLTGLLASHGIGPGDRVAALATNSHVMLELHHGVPGLDAVLVALNIRQSEAELRTLLRHSGASILVATHEFEQLAARLGETTDIPVLVAGGAGSTYERGLAGADEHPWDVPDERSLLAINYTSGTTGRPKGVMYHHRGAYLQALAMAYHASLGPRSSYLWTLPMFHCNGWCFPWAVTAAGGTHVCLREIDADRVWELMRFGVTHFSAAPTVLTMIADSASASRLEHPVHLDTGGAPPSPALLARMADLNIGVTHLYGLTETFGPVVINQWQPSWDDLDPAEAAERQARQGVANIIATPVRVVGDDGVDVPADGATPGELLLSGNDLMLGYYNDPQATEDATFEGWFRTGDIAVMHPDHYVEIRDRSKDVIISGGENIASVEVERAIDSHPAVLESAVVGAPDERWGEVPVGFVSLARGQQLDTDELIGFLRDQLAGYKIPRRYVLGELPRTSTGKIRKNELRATLRSDPIPETP